MAINKKEFFLSGNEAVALGAYHSSIHVATSYPGTPATEIVEYLVRFRTVKSQWSVNEKVAFEVAYGAAVGGARSLFVAKHVGLNVAMDPLMTASYTGTEAGFVIVVCDDPGMYSSQNEQDSRWVSLSAKIPMLEPSSSQEAYDMASKAFLLSEKFDTPVMIRMTTRISHTKENCFVGKRISVKIKKQVRNAEKYVMLPSYAIRRHVLVEKRTSALSKESGIISCNRIEKGAGNIGYITSGATYQYVKEFAPNAPILKLGMSWPLNRKQVTKFAQMVKTLFVIEELDPFLEQQIRNFGIKNLRCKDISFCVGELSPDDIQAIILGKKRILHQRKSDTLQFCKGCSYHTIFAVLKKLDITVAGDIGCYTIGTLEPYNSMHHNICMGSSITVHEGLRIAHPKSRTVAVIGDSTFIHSGITGLINSVYNGSKGVIIILDNSTTAMTGGQEHPSSGKTLMGKKAPILDLEKLCIATGVENVDVINTRNEVGLEKLITKRINQSALSVIIAKSPCVLHIKKEKKV